MDASVIQAKHHRPNKGAAGESTQATEAGYNVKQSSDGQQKTTDGYKAHLNVEEDGFISKAILKRAYRNTPLTAADKQHHRLLSGIRCTVERVFGVLKQHYGMGQARYRGKQRHHARLMLMSMAYNLKRGLAIQRACAS